MRGSAREEKKTLAGRCAAGWGFMVDSKSVVSRDNFGEMDWRARRSSNCEASFGMDTTGSKSGRLSVSTAQGIWRAVKLIQGRISRERVAEKATIIVSTQSRVVTTHKHTFIVSKFQTQI